MEQKLFLVSVGSLCNQSSKTKGFVNLPRRKLLSSFSFPIFQGSWESNADQVQAKRELVQKSGSCETSALAFLFVKGRDGELQGWIWKCCSKANTEYSHPFTTWMVGNRSSLGKLSTAGNVVPCSSPLGIHLPGDSLLSSLMAVFCSPGEGNSG